MDPSRSSWELHLPKQETPLKTNRRAMSLKHMEACYPTWTSSPRCSKHSLCHLHGEVPHAVADVVWRIDGCVVLFFTGALSWNTVLGCSAHLVSRQFMVIIYGTQPQLPCVMLLFSFSCFFFSEGAFD